MMKKYIVFFASLFLFALSANTLHAQEVKSCAKPCVKSASEDKAMDCKLMTKEQCALLCAKEKSTRVASASDSKAASKSTLVKPASRIKLSNTTSNVRTISASAQRSEIKALKPATKQCSQSCKKISKAKA